MQVNIKHLIDDVQCYQTVRELRWPDGVVCPSCESTYVLKRGFDDTEPARQRYEPMVLVFYKLLIFTELLILMM